MRAADDLPHRRSRRFRGSGRYIALAVVAILLVLLFSLRGIAGFYTDYLWFESLDRASVWRQVLGAKLALTLIFGGFFFVTMWVNLYIADRSAPAFRPAGPEEELLARYHDVVAGRAGLIRTGVSALFALIAAAGVPSHWEQWLLFVNRKDFGIDDPQFGTDLGFFVFQLPFLSYVVGWAFAAFVIIFILTAIAHYLNGSIRMSVTSGQRATSTVKVHLSAILAVLALIKAADYWLARYELTVSTRGAVDGALYTDVNAQLPALHLLIAISLCAVVLLVVNLWRRGWTLPVLAVGLWAFTAIVVGGIYPAFVQRFQVEPNETSREAEFAARNIEATLAAFGLDGMDVEDFRYTEDLDAGQIRDNEVTVRNARLLDPVTVHPTFERFQAERGFYRFLGQDAVPGNGTFDPALDTDRYLVDGEQRQVVLGVRELQGEEDLNWEREHVRLTHGYGIAMASANATSREGRPDWIVDEIPTNIDDSLELELDRPQIYHGEDMGGYSLISATVDEVDYVDNATGNDVPSRYDGAGGVSMGSFVRRAAFALRFGQIEPLISNFIDGDTRVIYVRDVRDRVEKLAPFLDFDADAYPVVLDGRIHYVIDGYTTTDRYPYAQRSENNRLREGGLAGPSFNYVRNSVKAVVDAYDGDVTIYVMPIDDPIIEAWRSAFPELFTDFSEMPEELRDHLRYPQDMFRVQTNMYARYQVSGPESLIIGTERWAVAQDPGRSVQAGGTLEATTDEAGVVTSREQRINPYYALLELPGEDDASFVTLRTFVPFDPNDDRKELEAFMVAETEADGTSRLVTYEMTNTQAPGPVLVASGIAQTEEITRELTLLNDNGSIVEFGDLLLLPIDDSILWVRSLYVSAEGTSVPNLEFVIAAIGEGQQIALGRSLEDALNQLFPGEDFSDVVGVVAGDGVRADPDGDGDEPDDTGGDDTDGEEPPPTQLTLEEIVAEIDEQWQRSLDALAEDPPDRQSSAAALDRIDELLAEARRLTDGPDPGDDIELTEVET
jgi:uncharacterized membrane protein (UPF0182 family)